MIRYIWIRTLLKCYDFGPGLYSSQASNNDSTVGRYPQPLPFCHNWQGCLSRNVVHPKPAMCGWPIPLVLEFITRDVRSFFSLYFFGTFLIVGRNERNERVKRTFFPGICNRDEPSMYPLNSDRKLGVGVPGAEGFFLCKLPGFSGGFLIDLSTKDGKLEA